MKNSFGQEISDGMLLVADEYERWMNDLSEDKDVRPLAKAAAYHMKTMGARLPLPEVAPCLAILYFSTVDFERGWAETLLVRLICWFLRVWGFRGRPMWNDFYMCLWQLSRDPRYIARLHGHFKRANVVQLNTGAWMVNSVCQQDAEFADCWRAIVYAAGEVFRGPISI